MLPPPHIAVAREAMATRFEIALHGGNPVALRAAAEEALDEVESIEAQLSLYRPATEIARVNALAAGGTRDRDSGIMGSRDSAARKREPVKGVRNL